MMVLWEIVGKLLGNSWEFLTGTRVCTWDLSMIDSSREFAKKKKEMMWVLSRKTAMECSIVDILWLMSGVLTIKDVMIYPRLTSYI